MVRYRLLALLLHLFHGIIEEEINQNSIDVRFWVLPFNLSSYQLNSPDAAGYEIVSEIRLGETANQGLPRS